MTDINQTLDQMTRLAALEVEGAEAAIRKGGTVSAAVDVLKKLGAPGFKTGTAKDALREARRALLAILDEADSDTNKKDILADTMLYPAQDLQGAYIYGLRESIGIIEFMLTGWTEEDQRASNKAIELF